MDYFEDLPNEITREIMSHMHYTQRYTIAGVCKTFAYLNLTFAGPPPHLIICAANSAAHNFDTGIELPSLFETCQEWYPGVQLSIIQQKERPQWLDFYNKWWPCFLLVPGYSYEREDIVCKPGVQVMNGVIRNKQLYYKFRYECSKKDHILAWFQESINNPEFRTAQAKPSI